jgi:hypothetical protein
MITTTGVAPFGAARVTPIFVEVVLSPLEQISGRTVVLEVRPISGP